MTASPTLRRRDVPAVGDWPSHVPPLLQRLYAARGIASAEQAELKLAKLLAPQKLGGIDVAVDLLHAALRRDAHIVVVGDFDCDGATGTAVAVRGLRLLGARHVSYRVPHRIAHGYGLSPALVEEELAPIAPDLVITVDSGIACLPGVAAAKARGWQVLVTDHHLPGEELPAADAIVNPNLRGDGFPSKALAGVGVVFYLLLALRARLRDRGEPGAEADLSSLLDLVAVGTVADLVPLDDNNRLLVAAGLKRLREGRGQPGVLALSEVAQRRLPVLTATDIGFGIGPRINAAGRLEDMTLGIECLLTDDAERAMQLAKQLDAINAERRELQQQMVDDAEAAASALPLPEGGHDAYCLRDESWHPGVVGLVASKLKEKLHRPVIAFAPADAGSTTLRGSARSIPGVHVRDALADVDALHPGLILRYGGHAMAAGLSLDAAHFDAFRHAFEAAVARRLTDELRESELWSDGELAPQELNRPTAEALRLAGPWGQGFPEPLFDGEFEVRSWKVLAERHLKFELGMPGRLGPVNAIHFGGAALGAPPDRVRLAFGLDLDDFRGRRDVQLLVRHWWAA
ncbi:single-stranded-DNA-specific exonuclease RecJ [Silanimonas sp.]|uniref:single-stranded-DNA-specific exonuclease RecJ n=1 Tax=Silanimonas sp. TaxID=1929290 RepID=UPI0022C4021A|nr:single-stranded-DNA-specific exonuclease RecJ [Silanimonas sp.]MCZ8062974.1 single-stranded-DNA-specific exonuclease RecJ [Silanimonas sp.]